jgi:3-oxoacyl-[acyl-carrier-protein] synthase III
MQQPQASAGILSFATYITRYYHDADYIAAHSHTPADVIRNKIGWTQKNVPGPGDHTVEMGLRASRKALYFSGLKPEEIDLVIWSGEVYKEYRSWTVGPKLQKELGLMKAWSFDMQQRCGTTVAALKMARDMIRADSSINNVLIATGYRNCDLIDYNDPEARFMLYLAAGGAACIVQRNCLKNQILESHIISDGSFSNDVLITVGGSAKPMTKQALLNNEYRVTCQDPEGMKKRLEQKSLSNWAICIDKALEKSGYTRKDIGYVAMILVKRTAHDYVMEQLGVKPNQTRYLGEFGHHGQNDQILSMELAIEENLVKDGDLVLMISAGIGYAWDAILVRWGENKAK